MFGLIPFVRPGLRLAKKLRPQYDRRAEHIPGVSSSTRKFPFTTSSMTVSGYYARASSPSTLQQKTTISR